MKTFMENYRIARIQTKKSLRKEGLVKYYLYYFMRIIFSLSIFLSPFLVSKWKLANEIKEDNKISMTGLFESVSGKGYGHLLSANLIKRAMYLAILLVIVLFGGLLYFLGVGIAVIAPQKNSGYNFMPLLFTIPAVVLLLALIIASPFIMVPNSYIVNSYPALTPGRILKYSFYSLKNGGKALMFKTLFFEYSTKILYLGGFGFLSYLPFMLMKNSTGLGITIILGVIFLGLFLYIDPIVSLIVLLIKSNIYDEIVFVKNSNKLVEVNINTNDIVIKNNNKETLNSLFKIEETVNQTSSYQNSLNENKKNQPKPKLNTELVEEEIELEDLPEEVDDIELEEVEKEEELVEEKNEIVSEEPTTEEPAIEPQNEEPLVQDEPEEVKVEEPQEEKQEDDPLALSEEDEALYNQYFNEDGTAKTEDQSQEEEIKEEPVVLEEIVEEKTEEPQEAPVEEPELEEIELEEIAEEKSEPEEVSDDELDALLNSIPEAKKPEDIAPKKEEPQDDDLDALLNSIPEKEEPKEEISDEDLDALLESIPEKEVKEESEEDLDALLNSIPEKDAASEEISGEDLDALLDSIPEKEEPKKKATTTKKKTAVMLDEEPKKKAATTKKKTAVKLDEEPKKKTTKKKGE